MTRRLNKRVKQDWIHLRGYDRFQHAQSEDFLFDTFYRDQNFEEQVFNEKYYCFFYDQPLFWHVENVIRTTQEDVEAVKKYINLAFVETHDGDGLFIRDVYEFWAADPAGRRDLLIALELSYEP